MTKAVFIQRLADMGLHLIREEVWKGRSGKWLALCAEGFYEYTPDTEGKSNG